MKIRLFKDDTLELNLDALCQHLNRVAPALSFSLGKTRFAINEGEVQTPSTYSALDHRISKESSGDDRVILFTAKPYDNNYFWDSYDNKSIVSLFAWEHLTSLPRNNGAAFLICALLVRSLEIGVRHQENTGCVNDFWEDKTGIDLGMRSGYLCHRCVKTFEARLASEAIEHWNDTSQRLDKRQVLEGVQAILDDVSSASRAGADVTEFWSREEGQAAFDVFVCHNSRDKEAVRSMNRRLLDAGLKTWFDEDQLPPGRPWQDLLEEQIQSVKAAAVMVGSTGVGPWQDVELRAFIAEFVRRQCPVIPVILDDCENVPKLPLFLNQFTWVDFRRATPDPFVRLLWGITGRRPS